MSDWITWDELKARCDLADHELIDWCKCGLQPYSKNTGNLYDCPQEYHLRYHAKVRISELTDQIEKLTKELGKSSTEVSKLQYERSIHEKKIDEFINEDPYCQSWEHFTFGRDEDKARELISELRDHVSFKLKDIEEFEKKHREAPKDAGCKTQLKDEQLGRFIGGLIVSNENDSEIKIQEHGKRAKPIGYVSLGFRDNQTVHWKCLQEILDDPDLKFALGSAGKKNSPERKLYERRRKQRNEINKKLVEFLKKEYGLQIPNGYKLYEKCPEAGRGIYKFKFGSPLEKSSPKILEGQFEAYTKLELIDEIKKLSKKYKKPEDEKCMSEFVAATKVALRKQFLSDAQVGAMLETVKPPEEHIYDPYENVKDTE